LGTTDDTRGKDKNTGNEGKKKTDLVTEAKKNIIALLYEQSNIAIKSGDSEKIDEAMESAKKIQAEEIKTTEQLTGIRDKRRKEWVGIGLIVISVIAMLVFAFRGIDVTFFIPLLGVLIGGFLIKKSKPIDLLKSWFDEQSKQ